MMKQFAVLGALICLSFARVVRGSRRRFTGRPEVLVTTVTPRDVPRVLERVATLDGFINANINAQVQGYIVSRDYQEGSGVKRATYFFRSTASV